MSAECCCTPSQWYPQIRSWSVTSAARRPALAGRSRTCAVQARCNSAPVSATQSSAVLDWLCYVSLGHRQQIASDYALPVVTNFMCHITNLAHLVVGPLLSLDQRLGIRCQLTSVIRCVVTSLSDVHWKHSCSLSTSVSSALEVFLRRCAI